MKQILTIYLLLQTTVVFSQSTALFKITAHGKTGYIDSHGKTVIKPAYFTGTEFSEGLAAVREKGLFGYINESGNYVLPPQYDYAGPFLHGIAKVYKNEKPVFINRTGKAVLPGWCTAFTYINDKNAIVTNENNKKGLVDLKTGRLIIDTLYFDLRYYSPGILIARKLIITADQKKQPLTGVLNISGKSIVEFDRYDWITPFSEGYARARTYNAEETNPVQQSVINSKGETVLLPIPVKDSIISGDFHSGLATITLPGDREGYVNLEGKTVYIDNDERNLQDFSHNRVFLKQADNTYLLADTHFNIVSSQKFYTIPEDSFYNGLAYVSTKTGSGAIDTSGRFIIQPKYEGLSPLGSDNKYFIYGDPDDSALGIIRRGEKIITKPVIEDYDRRGFVNGLIKVIIKGRLSYINTAGKIVWQESKDEIPKLKLMNIDFMNRGYFYAYSSPKKEERSGGWAVSDNIPQKIKGLTDSTGKLMIKIEPNMTDTFAQQFYGCRLLIENTSAETIRFQAQDSRLYMKLQALNKEGQWHDIEYLPSSWCGNSYHQVELPAGSFWSFTIPEYSGAYKTKIRAQLLYIDKNDPQKQLIVLSNEIEGSINPGQFCYRQAYYRSGLMDPYND